MLSSIRNMDCEKDGKKILENTKSVLEHRFSSNHIYCDTSWCTYLKAKAKGKKTQKPKEKGYYTKVSSCEKYRSVKTCLQEFMTEDVLLESVHTMNTQKNESLNQSVAWVCQNEEGIGEIINDLVLFFVFLYGCFSLTVENNSW